MSQDQLLSPEELEALLSEHGSGPSHTPASSATTAGTSTSRIHRSLSTQPYDLQATLTLTPRQQAVLHQWGEQLAQSLRYQLALTLRMALELRLQSETLTPLVDLTEEWNDRAIVAPFTATGRLRGDHYWALSHDLAAISIDRLLGGPGVGVLDRPSMSRLEMDLLTRMAQRMCGTLHSVLGGDDEVGKDDRFQVESLVTAPEQMSMVADDGFVYAFMYEAQLSNTSGTLWLCLRADSLKTVEEATNAKHTPEPEELRSHVLSHLPLSLRVVLADGSVSVRDVEQLGAGDVIMLNGFRGAPVQIGLGDRTLLYGQPGTREGQLAVRVVAPGRQLSEVSEHGADQA